MKLIMKENKNLILDTAGEKIYVGENGFAKFSVFIPDAKINELIATKDCEFDLKIQLAGGSISTYRLSLSLDNVANSSKKMWCGDVDVTLDLTDTAGTLKAFLVITKNGGIVGKTNTVDIEVYPSPDGSEAVPRAELIATISADENDFNFIKAAIIEKGVEIPDDTEHTQYADKIKEIKSGDKISFIPRVVGDNYLVNVDTETESELVSVVPDGVTTISNSVYMNNRIVNKVVMPDTVVTLEHHPYLPDNGVFKGASNLNEVVLSNNISEIPANCFVDCYSLNKVKTRDDTEEDNTTLKVSQIGSYAFQNTKLSDSITVENSSGTTGYIGINAFSSTPITYFNVSVNGAPYDFDDGVFEDCSNLYQATLYIDEFPARCFNNCSSLSTISSDSMTIIVRAGSYAFSNTAALFARIGTNNTSGIAKYEDRAFWGSGISGVNIYNLRYIKEYCFTNCEKLKYAIFQTFGGSPEDQSLGDGIFAGCTSLKAIYFGDGIRGTIPDLGINGINYQGNNIVGCTALTDIYFKCAETDSAYTAFLANNTVPEGVTVHFETPKSAIADIISATERD